MAGKAHKRPSRHQRKPDTRVKDPVAVAPLRDYYLRALEREDFTICDLAERLGWHRNGQTHCGLDTTRVQRMFGVKGYSSSRKKNGKRYSSGPRDYVSYPTAVALCRAMGADPVDFDL